MDVNGAKALADRIVQYQHWRSAQAVRDGRQDEQDPDADRLEAMGDGLRVYSLGDDERAEPRYKVLVGGRWEWALEPDAVAFAAE